MAKDSRTVQNCDHSKRERNCGRSAREEVNEEKDFRHDPPHHQFARCSSRFVGLRASAEPGLGSAEPTKHRCSNLANAHERRHDGEISSLICPDNLSSWRANTGGACAQWPPAQTFKNHGEDHETGNMADLYGSWVTPQVQCCVHTACCSSPSRGPRSHSLVLSALGFRFLNALGFLLLSDSLHPQRADS